MTEKEVRVKLLELEIEALRSVISEFDQEDLNCYTQWHKAEAIARLLDCLK